VGEYVDAGCLREQHGVTGGGVGDRAQALRVRGLDECPDRGLVEAGEVNDDLDVVRALGGALGHVGLRLAGIGDQARRAPHPLGVRAGRVGGTGAARVHVGDAPPVAQRRDKLGWPGSHVEGGRDALPGQRCQRRLVSEVYRATATVPIVCMTIL